MSKRLLGGMLGGYEILLYGAFALLAVMGVALVIGVTVNVVVILWN